MKIAILSSGPSIIEQWGAQNEADWDVTVGISTTCWHIDVDWMCWMDGIVINGMIERGRKPKIGCVWHVSDLKFWPELDHDSYPTYEDGTKAEYTLPNALNWVLNRFERPEVAIFGNDMDSQPNVSGGSYNHNNVRWLYEAEQIKRVLLENQEKRRQMKLFA